MSAEVELLRRLAEAERRLDQIYNRLFCTFVPLAIPVAAINLDTFSSVGVSTEITAATMGTPATAKAVEIGRLEAYDSGVILNLFFSVGHSATYYADKAVHPSVNNIRADTGGVCATDANGSIWYQCAASGVNTLTVYLLITGYYL